jgi:hypothetical protein
MKRFTFIIMMAILVVVWGNSAFAVKKVPKTGNDTTANKAVQSDSVKPNQPAANQQQPPAATRPSAPITIPPKDDFIDRDGDGINDNLERSKPPEIKNDRFEPPPKREPPPARVEPPPRQNPPKSSAPEQKKDDSKEKRTKR